MHKGGSKQKDTDASLILAVETSGRMGSVALAQGAKLLGEQHFTGPMRHSAEVFPAILGLLEQFGKKASQIEQVYISVGPGSFTGLRIAVTIAKTIALANRAKIVAVDTLDCIAANVISFTTEHTERKNELKQNERIAVILDAKRGQFFVAVYEKTQDAGRRTQDAIWQKILPDCLMTAEEFLDRFAGCGKPIALIGEGLVYYKDKFSDPAVRFLDEKFWNPTAANVHRLGWQMAQSGRFTNPLTLTPNYLRQPDVKFKQI
jgi:tRNA threonylcarbamoyladenosine biosynthesis protein TsaB